MSLLPHATNANPTTSYFALAGDAGGAVETAGGFIATGVDGPANGLFVAKVDAVPGGDGVFTIATSAGTTQWSLGVSTVQGPGNVGNDLTLFAYDNSGAFLNAPLVVERATGNISMPQGELIVGVGTDASGGIIEVDGVAGVSRVFDGLYNPPVIGSDSLMYSQGADGTVAIDVGFTPAVTGTYVLSATVNGAGSGWSWAAGNSLNYALTYNGGVNVVAGAQIYIAGLVDPTGMGARGPLGADTFEYQTDILVSLTAGTAYDIVRGSTGGAYNMGAGGGVGITVAFLTA
jgi:hypothetical protein